MHSVAGIILQSRILVDSSVWIDYLADRDVWQTNFLEGAFTTHEICLCDLVLTEVLQGIGDDAKYRRTRDLLLNYTFIPTHGKRLAVRSAEHYRSLRKRGVTLRSSIDCIIATATIAAQVPMLANDRDYLPFVQHLGLQLIRE
jgi:predicted nucleic acid-binding protein